MMRIIPEWVVKIQEELKDLVLKLALRNGIPYELVEDSKNIESCINSISYELEEKRNLLESCGTSTRTFGIGTMRAYQDFVPIAEPKIQEIPKFPKPTEEEIKQYEEEEKKYEEEEKLKEIETESVTENN